MSLIERTTRKGIFDNGRDCRSTNPCRAILTVFPLEHRIAPACPVGPEFRVNTYTTNSQTFASIAIDHEGDFAVSWQSGGQDGSGDGIFAQRFNWDMASGSEFSVSTYTTNSQYEPSIAMDHDGDFVIAWTTSHQDEDGSGIYAQRFNALGVPLGGEFRVNTYTTGGQIYSSIAMDNDGDFVIAWSSSWQDGSSLGIYAQRFNSLGQPQGVEFAVNTYTTQRQSFPSVAMDEAGDFVIVWDSYLQDGSNYGIYAQRFNSLGEPQGGEFQVNTYTTNVQMRPSVAMDQDGDFVIAWRGQGQDASGSEIYAQCFNSAGISQTGEFRVNTIISGGQNSPAVAMNNDGDFVVTWTTPEIQARAYQAGGIAQGDEFRVNTTTANAQDFSAVAMTQNGDFVVAWNSDLQDGDSRGVYGQRFTHGPPEIASTKINDGSAQRSRVNSLTLTLSENITFPNGIANAFQLTRTGPGGPIGTVALNPVQTNNVVTLNFDSGGAVGLDPGGSLIDGNYELTVFANQVLGACGMQLDGNGDGTPGDNYTFSFHRLFGDADGNGTVNSTDFAVFRMSFGLGASIFDFDGDGQTNSSDFAEFRKRFGLTIVP